MEASALGWLAFKGVAVAALPLAYVFLSRDPAKFRKLAWVTAFLTLDLIMFGSFTRLTDSGLGCPDWPGCYGHSNPISAGEPISAAETAQPTGPVTMTKAWIEMLHRYFAMGVGFLIIILAVQAWRRPRDTAAPSRWLATAALVWVCVQGAFGALTVTMKLQPIIVTAHLLGGMVLLALLVALAARTSGSHAATEDARRLRPLAWFGLAVVAAQIAFGGWVSSNYAVLACPDFPRCQGAWLPSMDFEHGFTLWRGLGRTGAGDMIPFQALVAIHWMHRTFAVVVTAVLVLLLIRAWRAEPLQRSVRVLLAALVLQLATGFSNVVLEWPLAAAVLHSGGAALLVALLVAMAVKLPPASRLPAGSWR
ncbi:MAG TPA: COX15/CtaA family protein [Burkholderiaceae bacterium]|nr:COX15/CtaA family protein [Burkholderiaceae bacterium]